MQTDKAARSDRKSKLTSADDQLLYATDLHLPGKLRKAVAQNNKALKAACRARRAATGSAI